MQQFNEVSPGVSIPPSCRLGSYTKIYPGVSLGANVEIGDHCVIGNGSMIDQSPPRLEIPDHSIIRSHSVIYTGSSFKSKLETGHHVVIRAGTQAGDNLRVGNFSDIEGDCEIGDYCRLHGYVHVGKKSIIGNFVWLYSLVTLTNDPMPPSHVLAGVTIEDGVVICVGCTLFPGAIVRRGTMVNGNTPVRGEIPPAVVFTTEGPPMPITRLRSMRHEIQMPWMNHFSDAYPKEAQERLECLRVAIINDAKGRKC